MTKEEKIQKIYSLLDTYAFPVYFVVLSKRVLETKPINDFFIDEMLKELEYQTDIAKRYENT